MPGRVTKSDCVRFALRWLEPLKEYDRPRRHAELAREFRRDRKTIAGAIQQAFAEGYVKVVESETEPDPHRHRDDALEASLRQRYASLNEAIVVTADGRPSAKKAGKAARPATEKGDVLHEQLGRAMAKFIVETVGFDLRQGENFGFGSGRAIHYTVRHVSEFVRKRHAIRVNDLNLDSLCGNCQVKSEGGSSPILDANYNANELASSLDGRFSSRPSSASAPAGSWTIRGSRRRTGHCR